MKVTPSTQSQSPDSQCNSDGPRPALGFAIALPLLHMQMSLAMMQRFVYDSEGWMAWIHCHCSHTFQLLCHFRIPHCTEKPVFVCSFSTLPSHLGKRGYSYIWSYFGVDKINTILVWAVSCPLPALVEKRAVSVKKEAFYCPEEMGIFNWLWRRKNKKRRPHLSPCFTALL